MYSLLWHCWLGIRKSIRPKTQMMYVVLVGLSGTRCRWSAYGSYDVTATPLSHASLKIRMVYHFGVGLPRLSSKKGR